MNSDKISKKKLIILCPYPQGGAPSQRFRYEQYLSLLNENKYDYTILSFLDPSTNRILYQAGRNWLKGWGIVKGFVRRIKHVWICRDADAVFIHREATPLGPPWVEWFIAKILKKPIIFDYDDAIWLKDKSGVNRWISLLKWRSKIAHICRWSYSVSAGNTYLASFAKSYNTRVVVNPTTIDTTHHHNQIVGQQSEFVTIGWTGSHSTLKYLAPIANVLEKLAKSHKFKFLVIADRPPDMKIVNLEFIKWNQNREIEDLMHLNIGVMPLPDDPWAKGKCGFKALQYLALGIPAVVSPVGVNQQIVVDGVHGYHAATEEEWFVSLETLLANAQLRTKMGLTGRKQVVEQYSIASNTANFLSLLP